MYSVTRFFFAQKIRPGTHMNRKKRFSELFSFWEDIQLQSKKIMCPSSQQLQIFCLINGRFHSFKLFIYLLIIKVSPETKFAPYFCVKLKMKRTFLGNALIKIYLMQHSAY